MTECSQHTFLVLTKRPDMIPQMTEEYWPSNLWLGVSVDGENNDTDLINELCMSEFPFNRFVSFEPLLGPITDLETLEAVQWIIIGAQTGPGARQPKKEWVCDIVRQAESLNIPIFLKNNLDFSSPDIRAAKWEQFPKEVH